MSNPERVVGFDIAIDGTVAAGRDWTAWSHEVQNVFLGRARALLDDLGVPAMCDANVAVLKRTIPVEQAASASIRVNDTPLRMDRAVGLSGATSSDLARYLGDTLYWNRAAVAAAAMRQEIGASSSLLEEGFDVPTAFQLTDATNRHNDVVDRYERDARAQLRFSKKIAVRLSRSVYDTAFSGWMDVSDTGHFEEKWTAIRQDLFHRLGVIFPDLSLELDELLYDGEYQARFNMIRGPMHLLADGTQDPLEQVLESISRDLRRHAPMYMTTAQLESMLARLNEAFPMLVFNVMERYEVCQLRDVLKLLLAEQLSVRDLRTILEALLEVAGCIRPAPSHQVAVGLPYAHLCVTETDSPTSVDYAECVRNAMRWPLVNMIQGSDRNRIAVFTLDAALTARLRTSKTDPLSIDERDNLIAGITDELHAVDLARRMPIIATHTAVRRTLRNLVDYEFPEVTVVTVDTLADADIKPVASISA